MQFTRAFVISSAPAPWQLARLIFKMLVSTRAAGAVQQIACRIPGLRLPPVQFTGVFAHNVVMVQYDAAGFVGHVVLSGSHAGLSLRLFPLPSHVVCHAFVSARAALDGTGYASNSALSVVFVCQGFLRI